MAQIESLGSFSWGAKHSDSMAPKSLDQQGATPSVGERAGGTAEGWRESGAVSPREVGKVGWECEVVGSLVECLEAEMQ